MQIPQSISVICVYTGHIFLLVAVTAFIYKMYGIAILSILIYLTTVNHWYKLHKYSVVKFLDIILVIFSIFYVTFVASHHFLPHHRDMWIYVMCFAIFVYTLNCLVYYYQTERKYHTCLPDIQQRYEYFSLTYVPITNIDARNQCYLTTTLVHSCTLHLLIGVSLIYFIVNRR